MSSDIVVAELRHDSPEFDAAYAVLSLDIPPQFLEEREFLRNRLRVRDEGPKTATERLLMQEGYTLHLLCAGEGRTVIGAVYGHLIGGIAPDNSGVGFVTYISVIKERRQRGIGSLLLSRLRGNVERDCLRLTGKPVLGIAYEIESEGKEEIKGYLRTRFGAPLDIIYYQPAVRTATGAEPMQFWFQPLNPPITAPDQFCSRTYPAQFVVSLITNLLTREYVGPQLNGFDPGSTAYTEFMRSVAGKKEIGFAVPPRPAP